MGYGAAEFLGDRSAFTPASTSGCDSDLRRLWNGDACIDSIQRLLRWVLADVCGLTVDGQGSVCFERVAR